MLRTALLMSFSIVSFFCSLFTIPKMSYKSTTVPLGLPKYKKLVYFVIDGLRFDGFVPTNKNSIYHNNFTFTRDPTILKRTFFSVSSIPTTTTCRITGMMSGAPSNLIEEFFTFFMRKIRVETLPDKLTDRKMWTYGDDLWPLCFKVLSDKSFSYSGLGKKDMVKNEVELLKKVLDDRNIDVKFIHTISIDAFGHVCGKIDAAEIKDAQVRADALLNNIYKDMDEDTLLVVTSDHGVTNEGGHGGSSKYEMASFCGFYAKTPISLTNFSDSVYNAPFIEKFYDSNVFNREDDWIQAQTPYRAIHQDDILPTICYLMGIPAPVNTYGSLIPYIVDDNNAQNILLKQKISLLSHLQNISPMNADSKEANYTVTSQIYTHLMKKSKPLAYISFVLGLLAFLCALHRSLKSCRLIEYVKSTLPFIVTTVMVSHSYRFFASEDITWAFTFLITNFSITNLVFIIFFIKVPGRKMFEEDRLNLHISTFSTATEMWGWAALFFLVKNIKIHDKRLKLLPDHKFLFNCLKSVPQLSFILISQYSCINYESKIAFISIYPSLESLVAVHLSPPIALLIIYFLNNIDYKRTQANRNILLAFCPFLLNLEKVQQSINHDVFFTLTSDFSIPACTVAAFTYFIIPRFYIIRNFKDNSKGYSLSVFSLVFCFVCSWVMDETLVFQYFFVGRLFFVTSFFIADVLIDVFTATARNIGSGRLRSSLGSIIRM